MHTMASASIRRNRNALIMYKILSAISRCHNHNCSELAGPARLDRPCHSVRIRCGNLDPESRARTPEFMLQPSCNVHLAKEIKYVILFCAFHLDCCSRCAVAVRNEPSRAITETRWHGMWHGMFQIMANVIKLHFSKDFRQLKT